ncbi:lytic transglycosylase domain-containing protein [Caenimonas sedimenti]|uniref:Lytic transglycosylase domain-containing protein n=1 Tax=Caenimonas sedimenti TaxID=2596921 RepID=A0A562ZX99_9BURK|nr:lytic transglycosylase domain-containing protein [Caenimonas sedimenti]TWO73093.1 lytic transglycosylase domain-containing protein [Caenimonas sedimenti]
MKERIATQVTSAHNVVMLAVLLGAGLTGSIATAPAPVSDTLAQRLQIGKLETIAAEAAQQAIAVQPAARAAQAVQDVIAPKVAESFNFHVFDSRFDHVRNQMRWLPVKYGSDVLKTPDAPSRLLLAQSAAKQAGLGEVGLSYRDVYGIINAETSWIPRMGASKDGTPNLGIAQFEPATAKAMGMVNPADPVEAVHAAAVHMKDAALWSAKRLAGLKLKPEEHALKLREGVSIYYNLSSRGRAKWNGKNTAKLPVETRRHIANARIGAREAAELEAQLRDLQGRMNGARTVTAQR